MQQNIQERGWINSCLYFCWPPTPNAVPRSCSAVEGEISSANPLFPHPLGKMGWSLTAVGFVSLLALTFGSSLGEDANSHCSWELY